MLKHPKLTENPFSVPDQLEFSFLKRKNLGLKYIDIMSNW